MPALPKASRMGIKLHMKARRNDNSGRREQNEGGSVGFLLCGLYVTRPFVGNADKSP